MGKGRTTCGMILACLLKDILFGDGGSHGQLKSLNRKDFSSDEEYLETVSVTCVTTKF